MRLRSVLHSALVPTVVASLTTLGCAPPAAPPGQPTPAETVEPDTARVPQGSPPAEPETPSFERPSLPEVIRPGEVVPAFRLTAEDGTVLDSKDLVGQRPFVMIFFASWCAVCERKMPDVHAALDAAGNGILVIGVALDNPDTWDAVAPYIARHDMTAFKLVNGQANRKFATAYNPFGSVPILEVIDRSGVISELQRGWRPEHRSKLIAALEHVQSTATAAP